MSDASGTGPVSRRVPVDEDFDVLFRATYARLVVALGLLGDRSAAEDAVQDAFVQALRHWERVGSYEDPAAWVRRAALNRLNNHRRGIARRNRAVDRLRVTTPTTSPEADDAGLIDLRTVLAELPLRERTVIVLHHVGGVPVADLARDLGLAVGTIKSLLFRVRGQLRLGLTDPSEGDPAVSPKVEGIS